jgi:hypothetical protein
VLHDVHHELGRGMRLELGHGMRLVLSGLLSRALTLSRSRTLALSPSPPRPAYSRAQRSPFAGVGVLQSERPSERPSRTCSAVVCAGGGAL